MYAELHPTEQVSKNDMMHSAAFTARTCSCTNMHLIACRINLMGDGGIPRCTISVGSTINWMRRCRFDVVTQNWNSTVDEILFTTEFDLENKPRNGSGSISGSDHRLDDNADYTISVNWGTSRTHVLCHLLQIYHQLTINEQGLPRMKPIFTVSNFKWTHFF